MKNYVEVKTTEELVKALGLPSAAAPRIKMRLDLAQAISRTIVRRKLTQVQAAKIADVGRTVITAILNGNLKSISTDRLIEVAQNLGLKVRLEVA